MNPKGFKPSMKRKVTVSKAIIKFHTLHIRFCRLNNQNMEFKMKYRILNRLAKVTYIMETVNIPSILRPNYRMDMEQPSTFSPPRSTKLLTARPMVTAWWPEMNTMIKYWKRLAIIAHIIPNSAWFYMKCIPGPFFDGHYLWNYLSIPKLQLRYCWSLGLR